jgi:hypothetical protein
MRHTSLHTPTVQVWQQARVRLRHLRVWPSNASNPHSPVFSIGLLPILALAVNIGQ